VTRSTTVWWVRIIACIEDPDVIDKIVAPVEKKTTEPLAYLCRAP